MSGSTELQKHPSVVKAHAEARAAPPTSSDGGPAPLSIYGKSNHGEGKTVRVEPRGGLGGKRAKRTELEPKWRPKSNLAEAEGLGLCRATVSTLRCFPTPADLE